MGRDPFDELEDQLRGTIGGRAPRPVRRRRLRRRGGLALAVVALVGGGAVAATAGVFHGDSPSAAERAIETAGRAVAKTAACRIVVAPPRGKARVVDGSADPRLAAAYGIFRRPTNAADRRIDLGFAGLGRTILRDTVRSARAAGGARFKLAIMQGRLRVGGVDPVVCLGATRRAALAATPPADDALRAHIGKIMDGRIAAVRRDSAPTAQQLAFMSESRFNRSAAGGASLIRDGRIAAVGGYRLDSDGHRRFPTFFGIVPDRVRTIRLVDRTGPAGARAATLDTPVRDNVYAIALPKGMGNAFLLQWVGADGRVIRSFRRSF